MLLNSIRNRVPNNIRKLAACQAGSHGSVRQNGFLGGGDRQTRRARGGLPVYVQTIGTGRMYVCVCVCVCARARVRKLALYTCAPVCDGLEHGVTVDCAKDPGAVAGFWAEQLHDLTCVLPGSLWTPVHLSRLQQDPFFLWLAGILWM